MDLRSLEEDIARLAPGDALLTLAAAATGPDDKALGEARSLIEAGRGLDEKLATRDAALSKAHQAVVELTAKANMSFLQ